MTEAQIEAKLVRMVRIRGGEAYKFTSPGEAGVPDRIIVAPGGKVVFVELKTHFGRLAGLQRVHLDRLRALGMDARVVRGWEEARALVEEVLPAAVKKGGGSE